MTEHSEHPLAQDSELLERFVLETLDASARLKLEDHVRTCETCRAAVQSERVIVAGVRRLGRDETKDRLARRLAAEPRTVIPWRALAAAAVIVILVGVGITSRWFATHESPPLLTHDEHARPPVDDLALQGNRAPSPAKASEVQKKETSRAAEGGIQKSQRESAPAATGGISDLRNVVHESESKGSPAGSATYWTEGTILPSSLGEEALPQKALVKPAANARVEKDDYARVRQDKPAEAVGTTATSFSIDQRSTADLPRSRQNQQNAAGQIQTLVEQRTDGLHLTLYLDSLVDESTLQNSSVRQIGSDSAVVNIANQKIGYRLNVLQQQSSNRKNAK